MVLYAVLDRFIVRGDAEVPDDGRVKDKLCSVELLENSAQVLLLRVGFPALVLFSVHKRRCSLGPGIVLSHASAAASPVLQYLMQLVDRLRRQMDQSQIKLVPVYEAAIWLSLSLLLTRCRQCLRDRRSGSTPCLLSCVLGASTMAAAPPSIRCCGSPLSFAGTPQNSHSQCLRVRFSSSLISKII